MTTTINNYLSRTTNNIILKNNLFHLVYTMSNYHVHTCFVLAVWIATPPLLYADYYYGRHHSKFVVMHAQASPISKKEKLKCSDKNVRDNWLRLFRSGFRRRHVIVYRNRRFVRRVVRQFLSVSARYSDTGFQNSPPFVFVTSWIGQCMARWYREL